MNFALMPFCISLFLFLFSHNVQAQLVNAAKKEYSNDLSYPRNRAPIEKKESATLDYIGIYQKYISGIRGQECPMHPSCSNYGLKTFSETNFVSAFVMTSDRLLRCGHDHKNYSLTLNQSGFKHIDYPYYDEPPKDLYYGSSPFFFAYSDTLPKDSIEHFIESLINNQYHREALLEIMRKEQQSKIFNVNLFINKLVCLKAIGEYEKAIFEYETKCPDQYKNHYEVAYQIATVYYKLENFDKVLEMNRLSLESCIDSICKVKVYLLDGLAYASKSEWDKSLHSYSLVSTVVSYNYLYTKNSQLIEKQKTSRNKSPLVAGMLSVVPGLGYAYSGHKQTAISAFIIIGLISYATYSNFKTENYGMGVLVGTFNLSFFLGNIFGASKSAKRFNEKKFKSTINQLKINSNL